MKNNKQYKKLFGLFRRSFLKELCFCLCLFFIAFESFSQQDAINWYFGENAGVTFLGGTPTQLNDGTINATEGVASISNPAGDLMFYTDGETLYSANHVPMPNGTGLDGGFTSSQSAVILPVPGSNVLFYLFTAIGDALNEGIRFSLVDMTMNGGWGDIVPGQKNMPLYMPAAEKITAVQHCNGKDFWIITHEWMSNRFFSWLLTSNGLESLPVISSAGSIHDAIAIGCMKASPTGDKLALAVFDQGGQHYIESFDFNSSTGMVSNPLRKDLDGGAYGVEFSPLGQYLYYTSSTSHSSNTISIMQMDLCAGNNTSVINSAVSVGSTSDGFIRSLQLGPDGKLYFSRFDRDFIGVIPNPDLAAPACGFNADGVWLGSGICKAGLPNFNQSFFRSATSFSITPGCLSADYSAQPILDELYCQNPVSQVQWNFGDPASGSANVSNQIDASHTYAAPGFYDVTLILTYPCGNDTIVTNVDINCGLAPVAPEYTICQGDCIDLEATVSGGTGPYSWSWPALGATTAGPVNVCPNSTTDYEVIVTDATGLSSSAMVRVNVIEIPDPTMVIDSISCNGVEDGGVSLSYPFGSSYTFSWNTSPLQTGPSISNVAGGIYEALITNDDGCQRAIPIEVYEPDELTYTLHVTNSACDQPTGTAVVTMFGGTAPYTYEWSATPIQTTFEATSVGEGDYDIDVTDANGCQISDQVYVGYHASHSAYVDLIQQPTCLGYDDAILQVFTTSGIPPFSYLWSDGQTTAVAAGLSSGTYSVEVRDADDCPQTYSYDIIDPPGTTYQVNTIDAACGSQTGSANVSALGPFGPFSIYFSPNPITNTPTISNLAPGNYSVMIIDQIGCIYDEDFDISTANGPTTQLNVLNEVSCFGFNDGSLEVEITGGQAPYSIQWSNGETTNQVSQLPPGNYIATVTDAASCISQSIYQLISPTEIVTSASVVAATCGQANGAVSLSLSGGVGPYQCNWSNGQSGLAISSLSSGNYNALITDNSGCTASSTFFVSNNGGPSVSIVSLTDISCFGANDGSLEFSITGGQPPYLVSWPDGSSAIQRNNLAPGNYVITVSDASGCDTQLNIDIAEPLEIDVDWTLVSETCSNSNGSASVLVNGGTAPFDYLWNTGDVNSLLINQPAGPVNVQVEDANGCASVFSETIINSSSPINPTAAIDDVSCFGFSDASVLISGNGIVSAEWGDGFSGLIRTDLAAGNYSIICENADGCQEALDIVINQPTELVGVLSTIDATCSASDGSAEVNVSGGTLPFAINWMNGEQTSTINLQPAGAVSVVVTDQNSCEVSLSAQILSSSPLSIQQVNTTEALCSGSATGSASLVISGNSGALTYTWSSGGNTASVSLLVPGNYQVTVSDAAGCSDNASFTIDDATPITINSITTDVSCYGEMDASATLAASGGLSPYSVLWSDGNTNLFRLNLAEGTHLFELSDQNGCTVLDSVIVSSPDSIAGTITVTPAVCGNNSGTAAVNVTGGTLPYFYAWNNASTNASINNLAPGMVSVLVTDAIGCQRNFQAEILSEAAALVQIDILNEISCFGANDGALELVSSSPVTTNWSNSATGAIINSLSPGTYFAYTEDAGGCRDTVNYTLVEPDELTYTLTSQNATCSLLDGSISISITGGNGGYLVNWSDGATGQQRSNIAAGNYSFTIIDSESCSVSGDTSLLAINNLSIDNLVLTDVECSGFANGSAQVAVSGNTGNINYSWSNGETQNPAIALTAGAQSLEVSDAAGCSVDTNFTINSPVNITVDLLVSHNACFGESGGSAEATVSGGLVPYNYRWDGVLGSAIESTFNAGSHTLVVEDANGCSETVEFEIEEPEQLQISLTKVNATCGLSNGSILADVSGGTTPYSYTWLSGENTTSISNLTSGNYSVDVLDANGCTTNASEQITDLGNPIIESIEINHVSCHGLTDGSALASVSGGTGVLELAWSNGFLGAFNDELASAVYTFTVSDELGCSSSEQVEVNEPELISINLNVLNVRCFGENTGSVSSDISGGVAPYTEAVFDTLSQQQYGQNNLTVGMYAYRVEDQNGCISSESFEILQPEALQISSSKVDASCFDDSDGSIQVVVSGGVEPYNYSWNNGMSDANLSDLPAGIYTLSLNDNNGCISQEMIEISQPEEIVVQVNGLPEACFGTELNFTSSVQGGAGNLSYQWFQGSTEQTLALVADSSRSIILSVQDQNGCVGQGSHNLTVYELPEVNILPETAAICAGTCVFVEVVEVPGGMYTWKTDDESYFGNNVNLCFDEPGMQDLTLSITDGNGCTNERLFEQYFVVHELPIADFSVSSNEVKILTAVVHFANQSQGANSFLWDLNDRIVGEESTDTSLTYTYTEVGDYPVYLTAYNEYGCEDQAIRWIKVIDDFLIWIPNAFTPNNDGLNDEFRPVGNLISSGKYELSIFNRWGHLVFQTTNPSEGWDGSRLTSDKEGSSESEVYVYKITATTSEGEVKEFTGRVTLVR